MTESQEEAWTRYQRASHGMQSGVAWEMGQGDRAAATEPKHLRVGINSALVNDAALVQLLIRKGIITMDEYASAVADEMEIEVKRYEERANGGPDGPIHFR